MSDEPPPEDYERGGGGRMPPQNMPAEQAVLGSMLISTDAIEEVSGLLFGRDFYRPSHETIFDAIVDLYTRGEPADMITVGGALQASGDLVKIGGAPYLHTLASEVPTAANAGYYAEQVRTASAFRRLVESGTRITQMGYQAQGTAEDAFDLAASELTAIEGATRSQDYVTIAEAVNDRLEELDEDQVTGEVRGVPTGFIDLDSLLGGLMGGQVVVIAARPALGKSTLALDILRSAAIRHKHCSAFFSLEMSRTEIVNRTLAAESRVPLANIVGGRLSEQDWDRVAAHAPAIMEAPLFIDDSANMTMTEIRAKARRLKVNHGLRVMVIDYLQLMTSGKKVENRQAEVSEFSRQIKLLAKELDVTVVALSQLNRGPEQRADKRPVMSDLRESGAIEQDADIVILLHREDAYEKESSRPGEADFIVAKHRNGATRDVTVAFQGHYSRFVDMARPA